MPNAIHRSWHVEMNSCNIWELSLAWPGTRLRARGGEAPLCHVSAKTHMSGISDWKTGVWKGMSFDLTWDSVPSTTLPTTRSEELEWNLEKAAAGTSRVQIFGLLPQPAPTSHPTHRLFTFSCRHTRDCGCHKKSYHHGVTLALLLLLTTPTPQNGRWDVKSCEKRAQPQRHLMTSATTWPAVPVLRAAMRRPHSKEQKKKKSSVETLRPLTCHFLLRVCMGHAVG